MPTTFQHVLWGYELTYPDNWFHQLVQDSDAFMSNPETGQLLVRGEWNWQRQPVEPLWSRHIGMLAGAIGAKQVGSAPWKLGDAVGLEAEIVLPKKENRRLWAGILMHDFRVLQFMVTHPREVRKEFEPVATQVISSLRFLPRVLGLKVSREGLPLPPGYEPADPVSILTDIQDPENWRAYAGNSGIGALQAFYLREVPVHNWDMEEYVPFPSDSSLGFARLTLSRGSTRIMVGMMPYSASGSETVTSSSPAHLVFKVA